MILNDIFPHTISDWLVLMAAATGIVLMVRGGLRKDNKELEHQADQEADRLNAILKNTVDALEKKVANLEQQQKENMAELNTLRGENNIMKQLLQGRDSDSEQMKNLALVAMKQVSETHENVGKLYKLLESHFNK